MTIGSVTARRDASELRSRVHETEQRRDDARAEERQAARQRVDAERALAQARAEERRARRFDAYA